jgi:hypothetical protein
VHDDLPCVIIALIFLFLAVPMLAALWTWGAKALLRALSLESIKVSTRIADYEASAWLLLASDRELTVHRSLGGGTWAVAIVRLEALLLT